MVENQVFGRAVGGKMMVEAGECEKNMETINEQI